MAKVQQKQYRKRERLQREHDEFQQLKTEDPVAAQQYIDNLAANESTFSKLRRQELEKLQVRSEIDQLYHESRSQNINTPYQLPPNNAFLFFL